MCATGSASALSGCSQFIAPSGNPWITDNFGCCCFGGTSRLYPAEDHFQSTAKRKSQLVKMPDLVKMPHRLSMCHDFTFTRHALEIQPAPCTGRASGTLYTIIRPCHPAAGAEMRRTLGTAVFSGMLGVTLFGIFLTPVFFYVIDRAPRLLRRLTSCGR
jgi:hypothetical protein